MYANKGEKRSRPAPTDIVGKDIRDCHKPESLPLVEQFVSNLKSGKKDEEEFWLLFPDRKILNRFLAVRDKSGTYLGMIEYLLDFKSMEELAEAKKNAHVCDYSTPDLQDTRRKRKTNHVVAFEVERVMNNILDHLAMVAKKSIVKRISFVLCRFPYG